MNHLDQHDRGSHLQSVTNRIAEIGKLETYITEQSIIDRFKELDAIMDSYGRKVDHSSRKAQRATRKIHDGVKKQRRLLREYVRDVVALHSSDNPTCDNPKGCLLALRRP